MRTYRWSGIEVDDLPHLKRWRDQIRERPAAQRGIQIPPLQMDLARTDADKAEAFTVNARKIVETGQSRQRGV